MSTNAAVRNLQSDINRSFGTKTTTRRTISGLLKPRRGEVSFNGKSIAGVKPHVITAMAVSHGRRGAGSSPI